MEGAKKKAACITGATSGIGAVFASRYAAQGYDLILTGRRREKIELLANSLSTKHGVKSCLRPWDEQQVDETAANAPS